MNLCDSSWSTIVFPKLFCFMKRKKFEVYNAESGMIGQVNTSPPLHYHYQHHQPKTYAPIVAFPAIFIIRTYKFGTITGYMFINRDLISFFYKSDTRHLTTYVNFNSSILNLFTVFAKTLQTMFVVTFTETVWCRSYCTWVSPTAWTFVSSFCRLFSQR